MKRILVVFVTVLLSLPSFAQSSFPNNQLILFMSPESTPQDLSDLLADMNMQIIKGPSPNLGAMLIQLNYDPGNNNGNSYGPINGEKEKANAKASVTGVGFNYDLSSTAEEHSDFNSMAMAECYDIMDPKNNPNGGNPIVTAIFDTGISKIANTGSIGFFDPLDVGMDFINNSKFPTDRNGHGSHISSIVMNNLDNKNGAVQLKAYKTHDKSGQGSLYDIISAIDYAITDGIDIINMSFGYYVEDEHGVEPKAPLRWALMKAVEQSNILFIASAGNDDNNNDFNFEPNEISAFPASFSLPNIISVASANCQKAKSDFSNYGPISVDVFAPGENIIGKDQHWQPLTMDGTSQAAAFVTKLATYLGTHQGDFDWFKTKCAILNGVTSYQQQTGYVLTDGYINTNAALTHLLYEDCNDSSYRMTEEETKLEPIVMKYLTGLEKPSFEISSMKDQKSTILLTNSSGQIIYRGELNLYEGQHTYELELPQSTATGLYFFNLSTTEATQTLKFVR